MGYEKNTSFLLILFKNLQKFEKKSQKNGTGFL